MVTDWTSPVLGRTAKMLGPRYIIAEIREDASGGVVAFIDPHMLKEEWTGPIYGGRVRYTKAELLGLESSPASDSKIRERVEAAKDDLLRQVTEHKRKDLETLKKIFVSLSLILLCWYPAVGRLF